MTFKRFFIFGFLLWALLALLKFGLFKILDPSSSFNQIVYGILTVAVTLACCRRLGVLNYLEAIMVAGCWFVGVLFWDYVILGNLIGIGIFRSWVLWASYVLVMLVIFLFHKKRHVQIRKELAAHHHGHH